MAEISLQVSEIRDLPPVIFTTAGVVYAPSPAPTASFQKSDGTVASWTLTQLSSGTSTRYYVANFTQAGVITGQMVYITSDANADISEWMEDVAVGMQPLAQIGTTNARVLAALPNATAGAAGGLFIAGSNAATTVNLTGNLSGSVGSVTSPVTVGTNNDKTGYGLSAAAVQAIWDALTSALTSAGSIGKRLVDFVTTLVYTAPLTGTQTAQAVLNATAASYDTAGTIGEQINSAGSAGDPWATPVPGSYAVGTAGYDIGLLTGINARVGSGTITVISPVDSSGSLTLKQWQTYAQSIGTRIEVTVTVPTDPTGAVATWTLVYGNAVYRFTGSVISYSALAGTAVIGLELTSAQSGAFVVTGTSLRYAFALDLALAASAGELVPIAYVQGTATIFKAPEPV